MRENYDFALAEVLRHEGGFVDDPRDPGGMTNLGCTKKTWENWVGHPVDERCMRNLNAQDVAPLYKTKYWDKIRADDLPAGIDYVVFDCAINAGTGRAVKLLQEVVGSYVDGVLGGNTLRAVLGTDPVSLVELYCDRRLAFLESLPTWPVFGKGWRNRVRDVRATGIYMVSLKMPVLHSGGL